MRFPDDSGCYRLRERFRDVLRGAVLRDDRLPAELAPRFRVAAAFRADAERAAFGLDAAARPPMRPPLRAGALLIFLPRPEPLFRPPPVIAFSVAQARRSASFSGTPRRL